MTHSIYYLACMLFFVFFLLFFFSFLFHSHSISKYVLEIDLLFQPEEYQIHLLHMPDFSKFLTKKIRCNCNP